MISIYDSIEIDFQAVYLRIALTFIAIIEAKSTTKQIMYHYQTFKGGDGFGFNSSFPSHGGHRGGGHDNAGRTKDPYEGNKHLD